MDLSGFDKSREEAYAAEAKARWGSTAAFREYEAKTGKKPDAEEQLTEIFAAFGALKGADPKSDAAQAMVRMLQDCISANYYHCTDEILSGLGQMYVADERFRANIDAAGGEGAAAFVQRAIEAYCG